MTFPFDAHPSQIQLMEKIIYTLNCSRNQENGHYHAALESPTGTRKTMAILSSVIAWLRSNPFTTDSKPRKIFYAMRTQSQIKEVINEYKKLNPVGLTTSILGSRSKFCNNQAKKQQYG